MFTLLNPSALLALLGLLVPVAIHLWNRRPGREVAVGSLRWLVAGANRRLRHLRPEQLWLLLLRAAVVAVLAGALAGPAWQRARPAGRGQVLVSPELVGTEPLAALRPTIDSLRRRGYGLRWLAAGFPKMSVAGLDAPAAVRDSAQRLLAASSAGADYQWERVRQGSGFFAGQPLYVLTPAALRGFRGVHWPLAAAVTWQVLPEAMTGSSWLQGAALGDSLRLLLGRSSETQTGFRRVAVARPRPGQVLRVAGLSALRYETAGTARRLRPLATDAAAAPGGLPPVPVQTQPLRVLIYSTAAYAADARYLQAALRAAAVGLPVPLALRLTTTEPRPAAPADWLFWLTDAPLPAAWRAAVRRGARVWQEAAAPGTADEAGLVLETIELGPAEAAAPVFRRGATRPATDAVASPLWFDTQGRVVLSRQVVEKGTFYRLNTRLNPAWSSLADSPALPAALLALLHPALTDEPAPAPTRLDQTLAAYDQRALDPAQLGTGGQVPASASKAAFAASPPPIATRLLDLKPWFVLVAGLLFALERLLAARRASFAP